MSKETMKPYWLKPWEAAALAVAISFALWSVVIFIVSALFDMTVFDAAIRCLAVDGLLHVSLYPVKAYFGVKRIERIDAAGKDIMEKIDRLSRVVNKGRVQ